MQAQGSQWIVRVLAAHVVLGVLLSVSGVRAQDCCGWRVALEHRFQCLPDADDCFGELVGMDDAGTLYVLAPALENPVLRVSRDDGETWENVALPPASLSTVPEPVVGITPEGDVAYIFRDGLELRAHVSIDGARTFAADVHVADLEPRGTGEVIIQGLSGRRFVATYSDGHVRALRSHDAGLTWRTPTVLSEENAGGTRLAVHGDNVFLAWTRLGALLASRSVDGGRSWSSAVRVNTTWDARGVRSVTTADGEHVQVSVSSSNGSGSGRIGVSTDGGDTWLEAVEPIPEGATPLVALPGGVVHAFLTTSPGLVLRTSEDHGIPGTWSEGATTLAADGVRVVVATDDPLVLAGIQRREVPTALRLLRSCDAGRTWRPDELRLDRDDPGFEQSTLRSFRVAPSGRVHWFHFRWTQESPRPGDAPIETVHLVLERAPSMDVEITNPTVRCSQQRFVFEAAGTSCPDATWQWFVDGAPVAGETGPIFELPELEPGDHLVRYELTCSTPLACGDGASGEHPVTVAQPMTTPVDHDLGAALRVARDGAGDLRLTWSDSVDATVGYNVYRGTIASLADAGVHDHSQAACASERTGAVSEALFSRTSDDSYFLVTPAGCVGEGTAGRTSLGDRPLVGSGTPCGAVP